MKQLRFWFVATFLWLFLLYNIERIHEPLNIASFVYSLTAASAILIIALRPLERVSLPWLLAAASAAFLVLKYGSGYPLVGRALPITVTELCVIGLTIGLGRQIGRCIALFEQAAVDHMLASDEDAALPFQLAQEEMYREVRRARKRKRPLALVALAAEGGPNEVAASKLVEEVRRQAVSRYVHARIARTLAAVVQEDGFVARQDGRFWLLLPEADRDEAARLADLCEKKIAEELGVSLSRGVATFPDEEVTFSGLVERAATVLEHSLLQSVRGSGRSAGRENGRKLPHAEQHGANGFERKATQEQLPAAERQEQCASAAVLEPVSLQQEDR